MATYDLTSSIPSESSLKTGDILNCPYSGTYKSITLPAGTYQLQCWGAEGGESSKESPPGKGGYSVGTLTIDTQVTVYIYSGGKGLTSTSSNLDQTNGWNGGGAGIGYNTTTSWTQYADAGGGGGASDIRINSTSLYARVIVAGGGGGVGAGYGYTHSNPYGGGTSGGVDSCTYSAKNGGTQTSGGTCVSSNGGSGADGVFGIGGSGASGSPTQNPTAGGGGGGWYGGAGGSKGGSGSGGSGYVYTSSTYSNYPSGCLLNSTMYLTNAQTIAGNTSMPSTSGSTETGHSGNGYVRITIIKRIVDIPIRIKINGSIKEASDGFVKVGNAWKKIIKAFYKSNGTWINN